MIDRAVEVGDAGSGPLIDPSPETPDASGSLPAHRIDFLDALRGIAVCFVLVQHCGERLFGWFHALSINVVQCGQLGVFVFFLCSGFIIPASLERNGSISRFWISRFFRLYPMYWLSIALMAILASLGVAIAVGFPLRSWLSNLTMLQLYLGGGDLNGAFWTLGWELTFYVAVTILFLLGLHRRSVALSIAASLGCAVGTLLLTALHHHVPLGAFSLVTMFTGTVAYRFVANEVSRSTVAAVVGLSLATGSMMLAVVLIGHEDRAALGLRGFVPMLVAWAGAYAVFFAGLIFWRRRAPQPLRYVGRVSYSIYLLQGLVIATIPIIAGAGWLSAAIWVTVTIALSALSFRLVELPSIALGRRIIRGREASRRLAG